MKGINFNGRLAKTKSGGFLSRRLFWRDRAAGN